MELLGKFNFSPSVTYCTFYNLLYTVTLKAHFLNIIIITDIHVIEVVNIISLDDRKVYCHVKLVSIYSEVRRNLKELLNLILRH